MASNGSSSNDNDEAELMAQSAPYSHVEASPLSVVSPDDPFAIGQLPTTASGAIDPELYDILRMATFDPAAAVANGMTASAFAGGSASSYEYWPQGDLVDAADVAPTGVKRENDFPATIPLSFTIPTSGPSFSFGSPSASLPTATTSAPSFSSSPLPTASAAAAAAAVAVATSSTLSTAPAAESGPPHTHSRTRSSAHQQYSASPYYAPAKRGAKKKMATNRDASPPTAPIPPSPKHSTARDDDDDDDDDNAITSGEGDEAPKSDGKTPKKKHSVKVLARKAELARASRRRKKAYVQDLEQKVKKLTAKLEEINSKKPKKTAAMTLEGEEKERKETQGKLKTKMAELLKRPVDKNVMLQLQGLVASFVGNSRQRQQAVDFYLDRVEDCLSPGLQVKFALWGLDQSDDFYDKPGLWVSLMSKEVGLTPEQMAALRAHRSAIHAERLSLQQCEMRLKETRAAIVQHLNGLHRSLDALLSTLTPLQLAKFFVWVESNEWCMQMLDTSVKPSATPSLPSGASSSSVAVSSPSSLHPASAFAPSLSSSLPANSSSPLSSSSVFDYSSTNPAVAGVPTSPATASYGRAR